jgi:hypothetical protein
MPLAYKTPGVYREDIFLKPEARLPTGVPGFVGFAQSGSDGANPANFPVALHRKADFDTKLGSAADSYLADTVRGFFNNGGARCYVVRADPNLDPETALKKAVDALAPLDDLDLVAIPDAMTLIRPDNQLDTEAIIRVQQHVLNHCAKESGRLAILDSLLGAADFNTVLNQRQSLTVGQTEPVNGALYYPWLNLVNPETKLERLNDANPKKLIPPCGSVAGIIARTDARVGVFKAPANEEILGVQDLELSLDNQIQDQLNPEGVNCLRAFPGRGIRVWGARTLSRDPNWRYINIRRLFLTVMRWIDMNMPWATFEPNTPRLWVRIQRELGTYLTGLWRAGALKGDTPAQAFYVKCDIETNPAETREAGQVVTEIGLAPSFPAEFVIVRVIHRAGTAEIR